MALQQLCHVIEDIDRGILDVVRNAATWTRSTGCFQPQSARLSGSPHALERQNQRTARRVGPGDSRPLNDIDRSLYHCRLGQVFLSEGHWMSGD